MPEKIFKPCSRQMPFLGDPSFVKFYPSPVRSPNTPWGADGVPTVSRADSRADGRAAGDADSGAAGVP